MSRIDDTIYPGAVEAHRIVGLMRRAWIAAWMSGTLVRSELDYELASEAFDRWIIENAGTLDI